MTKTISFVGTGKMATALISSIYKEYNIIASGRNKENLRKIKKQFKIKTTTNNKEAVKGSDIVFICVKPQDIDVVLNEIKDVVENQLIVSIAAGIKIKHIESILKNKRVIRVMPNINCLVKEMAAGFAAGRYATIKDIKIVQKILSASGLAVHVKESQIDSLSTISGCGPAFFAYFIKHIVDAAAKNGLPREIAIRLASKTLLGTGKLMLEKDMSPDDLIKMVASKKGVTEAGLKVLDKYKVKNILQRTINAAYKRSKELGK